MAEHPIYAQFKQDIKDHEMKVLLNEGVNRHLLFKRPQSGTYWFEIVTWKGCLCIHGDMGTWTFSRIDDMLNFFRSEEGNINPSYWSEKLQAGVHHADEKMYKEFSTEKFETYIKEFVQEHNSSCSDGEGISKEEADELLDAASDEQSAVDACYEFHDGAYDLMDGFSSCYAYKYHFIWCLYAIVYGIAQFDKETRNG